MGGVVVDDGVDHLSNGNLLLDDIEEAKELLMAMALHVTADHLAVEDVHRGEQRRRAVPLIVVRHGERFKVSFPMNARPLQPIHRQNPADELTPAAEILCAMQHHLPGLNAERHACEAKPRSGTSRRVGVSPINTETLNVIPGGCAKPAMTSERLVIPTKTIRRRHPERSLCVMRSASAQKGSFAKDIANGSNRREFRRVRKRNSPRISGAERPFERRFACRPRQR